MILGGGRKYMFPSDTPDPEYPKENGTRKDGRNLVNEWLAPRLVGARLGWGHGGGNEVMCTAMLGAS